MKCSKQKLLYNYTVFIKWPSECEIQSWHQGCFLHFGLESSAVDWGGWNFDAVARSLSCLLWSLHYFCSDKCTTFL